jgi:putative intracellular protease/amidase
MKILMVLTSHDRLGRTGRRTGFWLEEFTTPYYVFKDAGAEITLASPAGGRPPLDPASDAEDAQSDSTRRFKEDAEAQKALGHTHKLAELDAGDFDAVFYPGGHGPLWDLAEDRHSIDLIESFWNTGKPVATVCHAPAVLRHVKDAGGEPLVKGRKVTGFSNAEETAVGLIDDVPVRVEDELTRLGGHYDRGAEWTSFVQVDGRLVTGQNPASSGDTARALLKQLA